jgi:23S rRNA-/tRNA-specific pseudouridylate synthase
MNKSEEKSKRIGKYPAGEDITDKDILFEDNHLIAVNKRAGDIVQVDETGDESLDEKVKKYIAQKYNKPNGAFLSRMVPSWASFIAWTGRLAGSSCLPRRARRLTG